jgi:ADP-ribosylglycohydrolase
MSATATDARLSKTLGALLGVHAGDSLGATLEFIPWSRIKSQYPNGLREIIGGGAFGWAPGAATDDTDLTRAVLLSYHDLEESKANGAAQGFDIVKQAADYSLKWMNGPWGDREYGESPMDIGGATSTGLCNYADSKNPRKSGAGSGRAGNGSLMRCIPTALFSQSRETRIKESMEISAITHNDVRCTIACAAYNEMVAALVEGKTTQEAIDIGKDVADELECPVVIKAIERGENDISIINIAKNGPGRLLPDSTSGFVLQSLSVAIAALLDSRPLEDILVDVVRIGGDTDTNGAIAGGLLGARDGLEAIPERWASILQYREEFRSLGTGILKSQGKVQVN